MTKLHIVETDEETPAEDLTEEYSTTEASGNNPGEPLGDTISHDPQMQMIARLCLGMLHDKLPNAALLVEEKAQSFSQEFQRLAEAAHKQGTQIEAIINMADQIDYDGDHITLQQFSSLFNSTLQNSIAQVLNTSKLAMAMVFNLKEATAKLHTLENFATEIQKINKQTNLLALNAAIEAMRAGKEGESFSVVAKEVKDVSSTISTLSQTMQKHIGEVTASVRTAFETLNEVATTDMTENLLAQDKLEVLMRSLLEQNERFSSILAENASGSAKISSSIGSMVMDMQFQDRNSQYMENACLLLEALEHILWPQNPHSKEKNINNFCELLLDSVRLSEFRETLHQRLHENGLIDTPAPHFQQLAAKNIAKAPSSSDTISSTDTSGIIPSDKNDDDDNVELF